MTCYNAMLYCENPQTSYTVVCPDTSGCACLPPVLLQIEKTDASSGAPLGGALFSLTDENNSVADATTNLLGNASFQLLAGETYTLREVNPPPGYGPNIKSYKIVVDSKGIISVDGFKSNTVQIPNTRLLT